MQRYARLVGIDVGTKRVGLARTDLLKTIASPVGTYAPDQVIDELKSIEEEAPIDKFIVGWPLTPKGEEGSATIMVEKFIKKLSRSFPDIEIIKVDESHTSNKAMEVMIESGVPQKKRKQKERLDRIAAAIILQTYLDQNI
ncbi:MAG: Holliday junction resolvase RuvX [Balneolaceae bacterium]|nr:Holliday junction resolvase RuvX [Balneolaceae bacterium]